MHDAADRRYRYPFINYTNCGPRFTIVKDVPYDWPRTTMAGFPMCAPPSTRTRPTAGSMPNRSAARPADRPCVCTRTPMSPWPPLRDMLAAGAVLAVKSLGGYHLAARAVSEDAVAALRSRKHREDKPFAILVPDLAAARALCELPDAEEALLTGPRRPIVLARRRPDAPLAAAPGNRHLGLMLPYTPLHHLLVTEALVLTSGNVSDEPIAYRDDDALRRLAGIADAFLLHDRPIHTRTDDSVVRVFQGRPLPVRRSRGYTPEPIPVARGRPVLAAGAESKNTCCLTRDGRAFISHHIGDLENYETLRAFEEAIEHFQRLFDITPELIAYDPHPEYLSTKYALDRDLPSIAVQHHHAHIASCLADNGADGPVIGVAFDGTGYGTDGTLWGGEFLVADLYGFERAGHLKPVPMPGGVAAIREPWRMAAAYGVPEDLPVARRPDWSTVTEMAERRVNAPLTSSMGRLFDAVAAVLGVRDRVNYEGQAAIELEQRADAVSGLGDAGFAVLTHHRVPPNDGGISLGQAHRRHRPAPIREPPASGLSDLTRRTERRSSRPEAATRCFRS